MKKEITSKERDLVAEISAIASTMSEDGQKALIRMGKDILFIDEVKRENTSI